jgi:hypothetical protein
MRTFAPLALKRIALETTAINLGFVVLANLNPTLQVGQIAITALS